ncbi:MULTISPECIES: STAS domain-containing protein [unclassified Streptomyces]|uniref:STAS domain-containing protein n=1 Tax=unclassified Streptomyces TaxID=2593676 RepID=UPI00403CB247
MANSGYGPLQGQLKVTTTASDGVRVITLAGEIDAETAPALRGALDVQGAPGPRVVLDMRGVTFVDSSGINVFISAYKALTVAGGWLRLAGTTDPVMFVIKLVGLDTTLACYTTLREALIS